MNFLIIGACLVVGLLAIVGVVVLAMSDSRTSANDKREAPVQVHGPVTAPPAQESKPQRQGMPAVGETTRGTEGEESRLPALNGQFIEFANELRSLHQQAWNLEKRLSVLTEMVDRIEEKQHNSTEVEMESPTSAEN